MRCDSRDDDRSCNPPDILAVLGEKEENERVLQLGLQPAKGRPLLLGITKASLSTDSFISAASFPGAPNARTLRVGVGGNHARPYRGVHFREGGLPARPEGERDAVRIAPDEPPPPSPEELELQREMDDLTDADYMFRDEGE